jgi:hypothetical protein
VLWDAGSAFRRSSHDRRTKLARFDITGRLGFGRAERLAQERNRGWWRACEPNSRRAANAGHRRAQPNLLRAGSEGGFGRETQLA